MRKFGQKISSIISFIKTNSWLIFTLLCFLLISNVTNIFLFDNSSDFMAQSITKEPEQTILHEVQPFDVSVNMSLFRRQITECRYQTDLTGNSLMYYSADERYGFNPLTINIGEEEVQPKFLSSYNAFSEDDYGFETLEGMKVSDYHNAHSDAVFVTEAVACAILNALGTDNLDDLINTKIDCSLEYNDRISYSQGMTILGVISDESLGKIGEYEGTFFVFAQYMDLFQYRITYASLRTILICRETTANRFFISNFNALYRYANGKLNIILYQLHGGMLEESNLNQYMEMSLLYGDDKPTIYGFSLLLILYIVLFVLIYIFIKKGKKRISLLKTNYCLISLFVIYFSLLSFAPTFSLLGVPIVFMTPISFVSGLIILFVMMFSLWFVSSNNKEKGIIKIKEKKIENHEYYLIEI